ncbi:MAG: hypothetical protein FJ293_10985, partial [Planctomycetes bacterium]|nr:hypothetical protein [Planctomycetota bacterium]
MTAAVAPARLLLPALLVALPLVAAWVATPGGRARAAQDGGGQEDDGAGEGVTDEARVQGSRPLLRLASEPSVGSVARPRQAPFLVARGEQMVLGNLVWEPGV